MCLKLFSTVAFSTKLFCLVEKQGMFVNDECSYWYNRVEDFLLSVWDRRKEILYTCSNRSACEKNQTNPTQECEVNDTDYCGVMSDLLCFLLILTNIFGWNHMSTIQNREASGFKGFLISM